jgi:type I restriction enzyme S subunit
MQRFGRNWGRWVMGFDGTIATIGDAFDLANGFAFKSADFIASGIPVIKIKNVKAGEFSEQGFSYVGDEFLDKRKDKLARIGDLLISMSGNRHDGSPHTWVGKVAYFNKSGRYFINQRVGALRPKQGVEIDLKFAGYVLASMSYQEHFIAVATSSGGQANLSPSQILGASLNLPSYAEQREIGRLISVLDDRIDLLRQTNTTLEAIAQALFKSWFVDFDPVHAKAEDREPEAMDAATAALFPSEFEASELGLIPKGWFVATLGEASNVIDCLHAKKPELLNIGRPYLQLNCIRGDGLLETTVAASISDADYEKWTSRIEATAGDCVITNVGRVGAVAQIPANYLAAIGRNMTAVRCKPIFPYPTFLIELLTSDFMRREIEQKTDAGTILAALNVKSIPTLRFIHGADALLKKFEDLCNPLRAAMQENLRRTSSLATIRDTLLPRLISGKLRLPEAEAVIESALDA